MKAKVLMGYPQWIQFDKEESWKDKLVYEFFDLLVDFYRWFVPFLAGIGIAMNYDNEASLIFYIILGVIPLIFPMALIRTEDMKEIIKEENPNGSNP